MTRVLSYNILVGGSERIEQLSAIIRSANADVIGLVEATNADVVVELAHRLNMQYRITGEGRKRRDWQVALLSRLPIIESTIHTRPDIFTRRHFLEVSIEGTDGKPLTVFVVHLTSQARKGRRSVLVRRAETRELLSTMAQRRGSPHIVMGDFNSVAPHDTMQVSKLLRHYIGRLEETRAGDPTFHRGKRVLLAAAHTAIQSRSTGFLLDAIGPTYGKGGIDLLLDAGYIDCFRRLHPYERGYTFPATVPALRIDYIFASPELASTLSSCSVIEEGAAVRGDAASDHLPVLAEFNA